MGKNVPALRFVGFTDDWEQRKLNKVADVRDGTHDSPKYVQNGHPFITSKNVSDGFINYDDVQYVTDEDYEEINKRSKVDVHDILMGMIGTIGNLALIHEEPDFAIKNVALIKYTGDIDYKYLYQVLQADYVIKQLTTGVDGGTQKFVSLKKIRELEVPYPKEREQIKIGVYFSNLDYLITLHQRKLEGLKKLKKTMLSKLFPKHGQKIPELRFQGFTDDWEQRKLGELIIKGGSGGTPISSNSNYYNGSIPFLSIADITKSDGFIYDTDKHITEAGLNASSAWVVPKEAISLAMYASVGKVAILKDNIATSQAFYNMIFEDSVIRDCIFQLLKKMELNSEWLPLISTGTQANLNADKVKNLTVNIPKEKGEMKQLSEYLFKLDRLITLHQRKLEGLQHIKKSLLQKMFVEE